MFTVSASLVLRLLFAGGCVYRGDPHGVDFPQALAVFHWSVTDADSGAVLGEGCAERFPGELSGSADAIQIHARLGQRIISTILEERVYKVDIRPSDSPDYNDDAFWCSTEQDASRSPFSVTTNFDCWRPAEPSPVKVLAQEVIPSPIAADATPAAPDGVPGQGRRVTLEVTGTGVFRWVATGLCHGKQEHDELQIL